MTTEETVSRIHKIWEAFLEKRNEGETEDDKIEFEEPATEEEINQVEQELEVPLPASLKQLYRIANGQSDCSSSRKDSVGLWGDQIQLFSLSNALESSGAFFEEIEDDLEDNMDIECIIELNKKDVEYEREDMEEEEAKQKEESKQNSNTAGDIDADTQLGKRKPEVHTDAPKPKKQKREYTFRAINRTREEIREARLVNNLEGFTFKAALALGLTEQGEGSAGYVLMIYEKDETKEICYQVTFWNFLEHQFLPFGLGLENIQELVPKGMFANFLYRLSEPSPYRFDEWLLCFANKLEKERESFLTDQYCAGMSDFQEELFRIFHYETSVNALRFKHTKSAYSVMTE